MRRILWSEITNGIVGNIKKYIVPMAFSFFISIIFLNSIYTYFAYKGINSEVSYLECIMYLFKGMAKYIPDADNLFEMPLIYTFIVSYCAYLIGDYLYKDIRGFGLQMLLNSGSRIKWWISKCIWNVLKVILYFVSLLAGVFIAWIIYGKGELINLDVNVSVYYMGYNGHEISMGKVLIFFGGVLVISIAMSLFQMALSLFTGSLAE